MKALVVSRTPTKFGIARLLSEVSTAGAASIGPLSHRSVDDPAKPGPDWHRVHTRLTGICGSDLSMVSSTASTYFDDWVSFPFVPGHEIVGTLDDGRRVIVEPVLGHAAHGCAPPYADAAPGDGNDYGHLVQGTIGAGIQVGFCCATGGGWAPWCWVHASQLHTIESAEDDFPDARAVLVEPFAAGIHAALLALPTIIKQRHDPGRDRDRAPVVAVLGAGTMGLAAIAGLRRYVPDVRIVATARYDHQRQFATEFGADIVVGDGELARAVRREVGCAVVGDLEQLGRRGGGVLAGGADVTIDAVGTSASITTSIASTRPRGRIVLLGMPARVDVDLTALWHRETELKGSYTYGTETLADGASARTFDLAVDTATAVRAERLLSATYPLRDYSDALDHAATAGRRGAVKIAFAPNDTTSDDRHTPVRAEPTSARSGTTGARPAKDPA